MSDKPAPPAPCACPKDLVYVGNYDCPVHGPKPAPPAPVKFSGKFDAPIEAYWEKNAPPVPPLGTESIGKRYADATRQAPPAERMSDEAFEDNFNDIRADTLSYSELYREARRAREAEKNMTVLAAAMTRNRIAAQARAEKVEAERDRYKAALVEIAEEGGRYDVMTLRSIAREALEKP